MALLNKTKKIGLLFLLIVLTANIVFGASCTTPTGKFTVSNGNPPNGVTLNVGSSNSYWNGVNKVDYSATVSGTFDASCTYLSLRWIVLDPHYNVYTLYPNTPGGYSTGLVTLPEVPGTYYWRNNIIPYGPTCTEGTCTTSPDRMYTVAGATLPTAPHMDSMLISNSYLAGTTLIPVTCRGSCPDPNGCDLYFYDDNGDQFAHENIGSCTGINCFSETNTYSGLSSGSYTVECEVVDSYSQNDQIARTFTINGTTCPTPVQSWISPTPGQGTTVQNESNYFRMRASSNPASNVDILYYFCSDNSNTCTPTFFNFYNAKDLTPTTQTITPDLLYDSIGFQYARWYIRYAFNSPSSCPDIYPRSNAGNAVSWYRINISTSGVLAVGLISPYNGENFSSSGSGVVFTYQTNETNLPANIQSTLYVDGSPVQYDSFVLSTSGLYRQFTVTGLNVGPHSGYVTVSDGSSTVQSNTRNFNIVQAPIVTLVSPADLYTYPNGVTSTSSSPLTWSVSASTATVDRLYINGVLNQTLPSTSAFIRTANIPIQGGMVYTWYINSTDLFGQSSLSSTRSFSIGCNSSWTLQYGTCQPGGYQIKTYIDDGNCVTPNPPAPADNGTQTSCVYCVDQWDCGAWADCQSNGYQYCSYSDIVNSGISPCPNATTPSILNRSCSFTTGVDTIDFSSNELVDLRDPFNKGILPDIWNGIIAWLSTPFYFWLLLIVACLTLFLCAVALLYWMRNLQ